MKKTLLLLLFLSFIGSAQTSHISFKGGITKAVNRTSFEPLEINLTYRYMVSPAIGFQGTYVNKFGDLFYNRQSIQAVVDITEVLKTDSKFQWLGAIGVAYLDTELYKEMLVFEEESSIKPIITTDLIYWFSERVGIGIYGDLIPYVNYNEYVGKQTIRHHSQLATGGIQISVNLNK